MQLLETVALSGKTARDAHVTEKLIPILLTASTSEQYLHFVLLDTGRSSLKSCQRRSGDIKPVSHNQGGAKGPHGGGHTKGRGLHTCSQPFQGSAVSAAAAAWSI